jgi:phage gp36-like protein
MPPTPPVEYCDLDDLERLGISARALKNVSEDDMKAVIRSTSSLIDSYLKGARYALPLASWGQDIAEAAAVITAWRLMKTRGYNPNDDKIAWLEKVAGGKAIPDITEQPGAEDALAVTTPGRRARVVSSDQRGWYAGDSLDDPGPFVGTRGVR